MTSDMWAGLAMATAIWLLIAGALASPPATPPKEVWVATSSDRVRSHPTLVRAADPILTDAILTSQSRHISQLTF